mmetsp:Transcript_65562/g.182260  ORF Transcript_65562/g.182260 Transcript_65562/m.182260 type:complete len:293 (+) Transcript_65562:665-1543(+)
MAERCASAFASRAIAVGAATLVAGSLGAAPLGASTLGGSTLGAGAVGSLAHWAHIGASDGMGERHARHPWQPSLGGRELHFRGGIAQARRGQARHRRRASLDGRPCRPLSDPRLEGRRRGPMEPCRVGMGSPMDRARRLHHRRKWRACRLRSDDGTVGCEPRIARAAVPEDSAGRFAGYGGRTSEKTAAVASGGTWTGGCSDRPIPAQRVGRGGDIAFGWCLGAGVGTARFCGPAPRVGRGREVASGQRLGGGLGPGRWCQLPLSERFQAAKALQKLLRGRLLFGREVQLCP